MNKIVGVFVIVLFCIVQSVWANSSNPRVRLETNKGVIILELDSKTAPKTVENFLRYVKGHPGVWFCRCIDMAEFWLEKTGG